MTKYSVELKVVSTDPTHTVEELVTWVPLRNRGGRLSFHTLEEATKFKDQLLQHGPNAEYRVATIA